MDQSYDAMCMYNKYMSEMDQAYTETLTLMFGPDLAKEITRHNPLYSKEIDMAADKFYKEKNYA